MIHTSVIVFLLSLFVLPFIASLYNPAVDPFNGKYLIENIVRIGSVFLFAASCFSFLVGTGWLIISTVFYGIGVFSEVDL